MKRRDRSPGRSRSPGRNRSSNGRSRSRSNSEQDEKSVIIGVRCHGHIGITWAGIDRTSPSNTIDEIIRYEDKPHKLSEFNILSTSNMGGICVGNPDLKTFIRILNTYFSYTKDKNMDSYIDHVFLHPSEDRIPTEKVKAGVSNSSVLNRSRTPMHSMKHYLDSLITHSHKPVVHPIQDKYINKCYTPLSGDQRRFGGFYLLHSYNVSDTDISKIERRLSRLTTHLNSENDAFIFRNQVCGIVEDTDVNKLTLCDFTCDVFMPTRKGDQPRVTGSMAKWLISSNIGKKKYNKTKKKKKFKKKKKEKKTSTKRR